jgi:poly(3-hydroxybutyrate) depolymerase
VSGLMLRKPHRHVTACALTWLTLTEGGAFRAAAESGTTPGVQPLPVLERVDKSSVTVSGLSSGGFFAHQFQVAYSSLVKGAGIMAGGPYACAEQAPLWLKYFPNQALTYGLTVCSHILRDKSWLAYWLPDAPDPEASSEAVRREHVKGTIDDPANLVGARVWLWVGGKDNVVPRATVRALKQSYELLGVTQVRYVEEERANHGLPIEEPAEGGAALACESFGSPFLIDCDYDAAKLLLDHLYQPNFTAAPAVPSQNNLLRFDQTEFSGANETKSSMHSEGYVYVPRGCATDAQAAVPCRLHVAFHGCGQSVVTVRDAFFWQAGYNRWAEANKIVVLYPQLTTRQFNPEGCWDWWGYSRSDYFVRSGPQMRAVKAMIDRIVGK